MLYTRYTRLIYHGTTEVYTMYVPNIPGTLGDIPCILLLHTRYIRLIYRYVTTYHGILNLIYMIHFVTYQVH